MIVETTRPPTIVSMDEPNSVSLQTPTKIYRDSFDAWKYVYISNLDPFRDQTGIKWEMLTSDVYSCINYSSNLKWWNNKCNYYLVLRLTGNENQLASPAQEDTACILEASPLWEAEVTLMGLYK